MSQSTQVLFLRISPNLAERIEAARRTSDLARPWRTPTKQEYCLSILETAVPAGAGEVKRNERQLDIDDVIGRKAKVRKVKRAAKVARKSTRTTKRTAKRGRK